jgi:hypothetical protein
MNFKRRLLTYSLGVFQAFIGITAIAGGFRLVSNPNGTSDIPIEWLNSSPFTNYLIPGLVLLIVIGFGNVLGGIFSFLSKSHARHIFNSFYDHRSLVCWSAQFFAAFVFHTWCNCTGSRIEAV